MNNNHKISKLLIIFIILGILLPHQVFAKEDILDSDERALLEKLSPLTLMVDDGFAPISYYDNKNQEYSGIAVEVISQLSAVLDFEYTIVKDQNLSWSDKINLIRENKIDFLGGVSFSDERSDFGYFNKTPYFNTNYSLIGNVENHVSIKNINELSKYHLGLVKGAVINQYLADFTMGQITYFDSMDLALKALSLEEIDLVAENEAVFIEEYFRDNRFDFEIIFPIYDFEKSYAFFFPKNTDHLQLSKIIDKGMENIDVEKIVSQRYQNKSVFLYYKEYLDDLRVGSIQKNILLASLSLIIFVGLIFVTVMKIRNKELSLVSETDYLTGLKNRNALFKDYYDSKSLENKIIYFIDLDDFKAVNDNYGHKAGDEVLISVAKSLQSIALNSDIYRMGGDEFILISNVLEKRLGQRMLDIIKMPIIYNNNSLQVFASIGYISTSKFVNLDLSQLINLADHAMLEVKALGKNSLLEVNVDNYL